MKEIFDNVSIQCSKLATKTYSTSFSMGILLIHKSMRDDIYSIYGFVRFADEIVDTFLNYNQRDLLTKFKTETFEAIENKISLNPILNSFQMVVNKNNIDHELIHTFLNSMEMDLDQKNYTEDSYKQYILGSAEVVGLMCLSVFTSNNRNEYNRLKEPAMMLGSAFQKINFLRDINADFNGLGRTYFPNIDFKNFTQKEKFQIEQDIESEFLEAKKGVYQLPIKARSGVMLAYTYYFSLYKKIKNTNANVLVSKRIRVNNFQKFLLLSKVYVQSLINN